MKCKLRLLFFTAEPWPTFRADVAVLFGKELPRQGICADLVALKAADGDEVEWGGGKARLCAAKGGKLRRMVAAWLHRWRCLASVRAVNYQAIQVRDLPIFAAFAGFVARWKDIPFYYWMSYPIPDGQMELARARGLSAGVVKWAYNLLSGMLGRWLLYGHVLPRADHVFVQSDRMRDDLVTIGIDREKMTPVPMGVDWPAISRLANQPPADAPRLRDRRVLIYLGTQVRPRRLEVLFEMLALVRRQIPEALLVLVGDVDDPEHRAWLRKQAEEAGVAEHVVWTGWLPMEEGWRYIRAAEVGLSPFPRSYLLDSASPTKVPEYLALGVPVVCNDNPDQAAMLAACDAGLCVPYTAEHFAEAVLKLLALDDGERGKLVGAGRRYVENNRDYRRLGATLAGTYYSLAGFPSASMAIADIPKQTNK
ncbi:MAG: glycosyltransferase [Candidatus Nitricoxidivorans perseverans]|uniref:Glycosyltransferase n=1 Tax=Candidatus Nitricoxidivorans perseverans TaxID=2975601 RepID=A0AA49FMS8_9PROT|nr:MAG: glycosyltransferase [Candidatus Nitricoxidivorans perseverans]